MDEPAARGSFVMPFAEGHESWDVQPLFEGHESHADDIYMPPLNI